MIKHINKTIGVIAALLMAIVLGLVTIQVIWRYVLKSPISWTQELSIYGTIVMVMLGTALAFVKNEHIAVVFVVELFPPPVRVWVVRLSNVVSFAFFAMLSYQSWRLSTRAMRQISPTTGIPTGVVVLSVAVGSALACLYLVPRIIRPYVHTISDEVQSELDLNATTPAGDQ